MKFAWRRLLVAAHTWSLRLVLSYIYWKVKPRCWRTWCNRSLSGGAPGTSRIGNRWLSLKGSFSLFTWTHSPALVLSRPLRISAEKGEPRSCVPETSDLMFYGYPEGDLCSCGTKQRLQCTEEEILCEQEVSTIDVAPLQSGKDDIRTTVFTFSSELHSVSRILKTEVWKPECGKLLEVTKLREYPIERQPKALGTFNLEKRRAGNSLLIVKGLGGKWI